MGIFEHFPYTNFHNLNLDRILKRTADAEEAVKTSEAAALQAAADVASAEAKATTALNTANSALNTANTANTTANSAYALAKTSPLFELVYDAIDSAVRLTNCITGEVVANETDKLITSGQAASILFNHPLRYLIDVLPPVDPSYLMYPNVIQMPIVKVVIRATGKLYFAEAIASFSLSNGICITFNDPADGSIKKIIGTGNTSFNFASLNFA